MKNRLLLTASILAAFNAEAATFSAAVVIPADKPALAEEIAVGLDEAFTEKGHSLKIAYFEELCDVRKDATLFGKVLRAAPDFALGYSCGNLKAIENKPDFPVFCWTEPFPKTRTDLSNWRPPRRCCTMVSLRLWRNSKTNVSCY